MVSPVTRAPEIIAVPMRRPAITRTVAAFLRRTFLKARRLVIRSRSIRSAVANMTTRTIGTIGERAAMLKSLSAAS